MRAVLCLTTVKSFFCFLHHVLNAVACRFGWIEVLVYKGVSCSTGELCKAEIHKPHSVFSLPASGNELLICSVLI